MQFLDSPTYWYTTLALLWATYQGIRGIIETRINNSDKDWPQWKKIVVLDIHDFAFRFICTLSGFVAMLVAYRIAINVPTTGDIATSQAAILASSFLVGIVGIGGQLHYLILLGRVPGAK